jgi:hypothetical protein
MDDGVPWWSRPAIRLGFLLCVLAAVSAYGVPRIIRNIEGAPPRMPCPPVLPAWRMKPPDAGAIWYGVDGGSIVGNGRLRWNGRTQPAAAWTDFSDPRDPASTGGYSYIWWSRGSDLLTASVFGFARPRDAGAYVRVAGSAVCRGIADSFTIARPRAARAVVWTNLWGNLQADVLFARGNYAFDVREVRPGDTGRVRRVLTAARLLGTAERVACRLRAAACG